LNARTAIAVRSEREPGEELERAVHGVDTRRTIKTRAYIRVNLDDPPCPDMLDRTCRHR
jgi:hypothetical protein